MKTYRYTTQTIKNKLRSMVMIVGASLICSCDDFLEIDPPITQATQATVFQDDQAAHAALAGIYSAMAQSFIVGSRFPAFSADELRIHTPLPEFTQFANNTLSPVNNTINTLWNTSFRFIYAANTILEGVEKSPTITPATRNMLVGEAMFIRAYTHFVLVNLFGKIPYITSTNYNLTAKVSRMEVHEVYEKILEDIHTAEALLLTQYPSAGRVRPNKWAATALRARVRLYTNNYAAAEEAASQVINQTQVYQLVLPNQVFLANSQEAIWQIMPVFPQLGTEDSFYILTSAPNFASYASLNPTLAAAFEENDLRKSAWVGTITANNNTFFFAHKYKVRNPVGAWQEYNMMIRLAELYLIRAEARTHLGKTTEAQLDINTIRQRAELPPTTATTKEEILLAIEHERRVELFTENGHRWLDLKRTNRATEVLQPSKPAWKETAVYYPIPQLELQKNNNLLPQNEGY